MAERSCTIIINENIPRKIQTVCVQVLMLILDYQQTDRRYSGMVIKLRLDSPGDRDFHIFQNTQTSLEPTHPHIQWVPSVLPLG